MLVIAFTTVCLHFPRTCRCKEGNPEVENEGMLTLHALKQATGSAGVT
jgi:hypothetical protein